MSKQNLSAKKNGMVVRVVGGSGLFASRGKFEKKLVLVEQEGEGVGGRRGGRRSSSAVQSVRRSSSTATVRFTSFLLTLTEAIPADESLTKSQ